jgi:CubicO group peptidase (beta-lactamase class C family)
LLISGTILILTIVVVCSPSDRELNAVEYAPLTEGAWKVSTPAEQGLDPILVAELYYNAAKLETLFGLLVVKNSHLIAERYFNEGSVEQKARVQSVTKSIISAMAGIALDQAFLSSVDQKMIDFFPEVADKITDPRKKQITIRHLLQMRAGYPWEESHPVSHLDVKAGEWGQDAEGHNNGCGDLHLTARDTAKFGLLYLNDGVYDGNQIVPADWVHHSLQTYSVNEAFVKRVGDFSDIGYGYHWWSANVGRHHVNFAWGHGGKLIVLLDAFDLSIVVTAQPFWKEHDDESWKHEKAIIKLVGKFIDSIPIE